jgi:hypothetical protein
MMETRITVVDGANGLTPDMLRSRPTICTDCRVPVELEFSRESGGLCGYCLAGYGLMTQVGEPA